MFEQSTATAVPEARASTPFGLYVLQSGDPASEWARQVEREVFLEFFGNTPELLAREYGPFEEASVFLLVHDHERDQPAGAARLIRPTSTGNRNKTVEDVERVWGLPVMGGARDAHDLVHDAWDVATIAVRPQYRRRHTDGLISAALFQGITMLMSSRDVRWVTATLDLVVLDLVQEQCGRPFTPFPGAAPRAYLDSPLSLPVYCDGDRYQRRLAVDDPALHAFLFEGRGLEEVVATPWRTGELVGTA
jgi:hypothetical protein